MTVSSPPQLVSLEVVGLLGQFDHAVKFDSDDEFVIIHGPNGIGKTKLLELISNVYAVNLAGVLAIPFDVARFTYADATVLTVDRQQQLTLSPTEEDTDTRLVFRLRSPDDDHDHTWSINSDTTEAPTSYPYSFERRLRQVDPNWRRTGSRRWDNIRTGESLSLLELEQRYPQLSRLSMAAINPDQQPEPIRNFLNSLHAHLIETQRLINPRRGHSGRAVHPDESEPQAATVLEFADDLKRRFSVALADNSRTSQQLDRQFPGRLLHGQTAPADATEENIRERYNVQGEIRKKLTEISLLDTSYDLPLTDRPLEDWERLVLWTYLDDTDKKLATFLPLLERVDLLRDIMNSRFLNKKLIIDRDKGFRFRVAGSKELGPTQLSSGEQHELVLVYDLLFNTQPNSLVLIDEPEISLHASWQQEFLSDIVRISRITSLRFIIATHSPQIIHEWWSRTVPLTPRDT